MGGKNGGAVIHNCTVLYVSMKKFMFISIGVIFARTEYFTAAQKKIYSHYVIVRCDVLN